MKDLEFRYVANFYEIPKLFFTIIRTIDDKINKQ